MPKVALSWSTWLGFCNSNGVEALCSAWKHRDESGKDVSPISSRHVVLGQAWVSDQHSKFPVPTVWSIFRYDEWTSQIRSNQHDTKFLMWNHSFSFFGQLLVRILVMLRYIYSCDNWKSQGIVSPSHILDHILFFFFFGVV